MVRDKYRIDAFIASGTMANVYAATHRNGSRVALKILHKDLARDQKFGERFRREGYFGNAVVHPGIVRAIDDDMTDDGCAFLVFELLEGETLEQKRERLGGKLGLSEALSTGDAVLDILAAAHDHQILHRDLKPDNVFLTRKGDVRLLDFGTARFNDGKSTSDMTGTGIVLGTPAFMAPEQAQGKREEVDARSDIWAVGALLFVCLTGQGVHSGGDAKTKLISVARTPARSLRDVAPEIPRVVASVIDRALAFDKAERWADAKSMRESLGWARRSLTGSDPGSSEPETRRQQPINDAEEPTTLGRAREAASFGEQPPSSRRPMPTPPSPFDDESTEKRTQIAPRVFAGLLGKEPQIKRGPTALSEGRRHERAARHAARDAAVDAAERRTDLLAPIGPSKGSGAAENEPLHRLRCSRSTPPEMPEASAPVTSRLPEPAEPLRAPIRRHGRRCRRRLFAAGSRPPLLPRRARAAGPRASDERLRSRRSRRSSTRERARSRIVGETPLATAPMPRAPVAVRDAGRVERMAPIVRRPTTAPTPASQLWPDGVRAGAVPPLGPTRSAAATRCGR